MATRQLAEAVAAMNGRLVAGDPAVQWTGAALDSRQVAGGELFFALPGAATDGHRFVADAFARGAAAVVVQAPLAQAPPAGAGVIEVADTFAALHALTRHVRQELPRRLVGLTGSAGKTTTKELLAAMLGARFATAKSRGNLNNLYGFPVSLLAIPEATEVMVAEMGMSTPGELAGVSRLGRPDVALLLNVRAVHLVNFGTVEAIAEAKAEILTGLAEDGLIVANRDDPQVTRVVRRHLSAHPGVRVLWFGEGPEAEITARAEQVSPRPEGAPGYQFELVVGAERAAFTLPLHGRFNVTNCVAAAACAVALGVPLEAIAAAVAVFTPAPHRGAVHELPHGVTLVDDSYNSNPDALARALESAAELAAERGARRRVAVLGDMLELGPDAPRFHREAGARAAALGFSPLAGVGALSQELVTAAAQGGAASHWSADAADAARWALGAVETGDLVLVKGSRGVGLDRVVAELLAAAGREVVA